MWVAPLIYFIASVMSWKLADAVFMPELLANRLFEVFPVRFIEWTVQLLGPLAKELAFANVTFFYFLAYWLFARSWKQLKAHLGNPFYAAAALWGVNVLVLFPLAGRGVFGYKLPQGGLAACIFLFATHWLFARMLQFQQLQSERVSKTGRRIFFGAIVAALGAGLFRVYQVFLKTAKWSTAVTPTEDFYTVSKNSVDPVVPEAGWTLEIRGAGKSQTYTLADICRQPRITMFATLACISNPVGGPWINNARWTGVPLGALLKSAGIGNKTHDVVFHAADGYTDSIPLERALHPLCFLAYEMNDAPLTSSHGFPLRLIVPGIYGMKNVKWITAIEFSDDDYRGFWQQRGWDDVAHYKLMSRIDVARDGMAAGVAFAGDRGVGSVQVKIGDQPWREAELTPALGPISWVLWKVYADVKGKGVMVRVIDANGEAQIAQPLPPFPEGSSGLHTVVGK